MEEFYEKVREQSKIYNKKKRNKDVDDIYNAESQIMNGTNVEFQTLLKKKIQKKKLRDLGSSNRENVLILEEFDQAAMAQLRKKMHKTNSKGRCTAENQIKERTSEATQTIGGKKRGKKKSCNDSSNRESLQILEAFDNTATAQLRKHMQNTKPKNSCIFENPIKEETNEATQALGGKNKSSNNDSFNGENLLLSEDFDNTATSQLRTNMQKTKPKDTCIIENQIKEEINEATQTLVNKKKRKKKSCNNVSSNRAIPLIMEELGQTAIVQPRTKVQRTNEDGCNIGSNINEQIRETSEMQLKIRINQNNSMDMGCSDTETLQPIVVKQFYGRIEEQSQTKKRGIRNRNSSDDISNGQSLNAKESDKNLELLLEMEKEAKNDEKISCVWTKFPNTSAGVPRPNKSLNRHKKMRCPVPGCIGRSTKIVLHLNNCHPTLNCSEKIQYMKLISKDPKSYLCDLPLEPVIPYLKQKLQCPVDGCWSQTKRMRRHLMKVHDDLTKEERQHYWDEICLNPSANLASTKALPKRQLRKTSAGISRPNSEVHSRRTKQFCPVDGCVGMAINIRRHLMNCHSDIMDQHEQLLEKLLQLRMAARKIKRATKRAEKHAKT